MHLDEQVLPSIRGGLLESSKLDSLLSLPYAALTILSRPQTYQTHFHPLYCSLPRFVLFTNCAYWKERIYLLYLWIRLCCPVVDKWMPSLVRSINPGGI